MATTHRHCRVIGRDVECFTKLGGRFTEVLCQEWDKGSGICRLKADAERAGELRTMLQAVGENRGGILCAVGQRAEFETSKESICAPPKS